MKRLFTMRQALEDKNLFATILDGDSWAAWRALLIASQGEPLTATERDLFRQITDWDREPDEPVEELWPIVGRRGGKTRGAAVFAGYFGALCDWSDVLAPGERGTIPILSGSQVQARKAVQYLNGIFDPHTGPRMLRKLRTNDKADTIALSTRVDIEVRPADWRTIRGITAPAAIGDEVAFWRSDYTVNPDEEILDALRPSFGTTGGQLLCISSPYARKGEVFKAHKLHYGRPGPILVAKAASRVMNPTLSVRFVERQYQRDPSKAAAEYGAEFRKDIETFISLDVVEACIGGDIRERPPSDGLTYRAFVDPSGGGADSMTLAIAHAENNATVLDAVRETSAGSSPSSAVKEFAETLKKYRVTDVTGDKYAGEWPRESFRSNGIEYKISERSKSDIYREFLPILNSQNANLLRHDKMVTQLVDLERRTVRGTGRDIIDHPTKKGAHDDVANVVAGVCVLVADGGGYDSTLSWV